MNLSFSLNYRVQCRHWQGGLYLESHDRYPEHPQYYFHKFKEPLNFLLMGEEGGGMPIMQLLYLLPLTASKRFGDFFVVFFCTKWI